jgi:hypothetical protein
MGEGGGGYLWLLMDVVLVVILGGAIFYGIMQWRHRSRRPATEDARDEATRRLYHEEKN